MAKIKTDEDWEARNDVDTLIRAQEILGDSKRVKRAKIEITRRNKATDKAAVQLEAKTGQRLKETFVGKK